MHPAPSRRFLAIVAALVIVAGFGACGGGSDSGDSATGADEPSATSNGAPTEAPTDSPSDASTVTIKGFTFKPATFSAKDGASVEVVNEDTAPHTLTAKDGSFDSGSIAGGASAKVTIKGSGKVEFFCTIHDYMKGTVQVG